MKTAQTIATGDTELERNAIDLQFLSKPLGGPSSRHFFPSKRATYHPDFVTPACVDHEISKLEVQLQYHNKPLGDCQAIPPSFTLCKGLEYPMMTLPNPLHHNNVTEIQRAAEFNDLKQLSLSNCHPQVKSFVCSVLLPNCNQSSNRQLLPCRSWCEEVKYACNKESSWSSFPNCSILPDKDCYNVKASLAKDGETECFHGNGANYRGVENHGISGAACLRWDLRDHSFLQNDFPWANLQENYCRSVTETRPWCYTADGWENCDVVPCDGRLSFGYKPPYVLLRAVYVQKHVACRPHSYTLRNRVSDVRVTCVDATPSPLIGCGDPGRPVNGQRKPFQKFYWNTDRVTYTCNRGYKFPKNSKPNKAQCTANQTSGEAKWSSEVPKCEADYQVKLVNELFDQEVYKKALAPTSRATIYFQAYIDGIISLSARVPNHAWGKSTFWDMRGLSQTVPDRAQF
ncbi:hypothetical protein Bbelb_101310 [Branchiostoma belcheri]|nr:hypothetical protein Bbelb_101310 [Branchiostoma belcheri]